MLTGYKRLDQQVEVLSENQLTLLAGRPGVGKTSLAINIIHNLLATEYTSKPGSTKILYITPGMPAERLAERFIFLDSGISPYNLGFIDLSEEEVDEAIVNSSKKFQHLLNSDKLKIIDDNLMTIADISSLCYDYFSDYNLIFIDYLQAIKSSHGEEYASKKLLKIQLKELKKIARKNDSALVLISQLQNGIGPPALADLSPHAQIFKREVDKIVLLHRVDNPEGQREWENYFDVNFNKIPEPAQLIIAQNQGGPGTSIDLFWQPTILSFQERSPELEQYIADLLADIK